MGVPQTNTPMASCVRGLGKAEASPLCSCLLVTCVLLLGEEALLAYR